jgi:hypothetical protein
MTAIRITGRRLLDELPSELSREAEPAAADRCAPEDPWIAPSTLFDAPAPRVVDVCPGAVVVVGVLPPAFDGVLIGGLVVVGAAVATPVLVVVGVADAAGAVATTVVVTGEDGACAGGTSVEALQMEVYDGDSVGGGSLPLSG